MFEGSHNSSITDFEADPTYTERHLSYSAEIKAFLVLFYILWTLVPNFLNFCIVHYELKVT